MCVLYSCIQALTNRGSSFDMAEDDSNGNALVEAKAELKSESDSYQKGYGRGGGVAEAKSETMTFDNWEK